jgi:hypothetical protein
MGALTEGFIALAVFGFIFVLPAVIGMWRTRDGDR